MLGIMLDMTQKHQHLPRLSMDIASVMHFGTAAYSFYIGLVALGISITTRVKNSDIHHHYFNIIGTVP